MVRADPCTSEYGPADNVLYKICSSGLMALLTKFATPVDIGTGNSVFGGGGALENCASCGALSHILFIFQAINPYVTVADKE